MKIALCLYGQPRFLNNHASANSLKKFVINKYTTDVYCHFWHDPDKKFFIKSDFSKAPGGRKEKYEAPIHEDTINKIKELYNPKSFLFEKSKWFDKPEPLPRVFKEYLAFSDVNFSNLKSQLYSWQKSLELFHEHDDGSYDFVVVSRFDNKITFLPNIESFKKGANYAHATYDIAIFSPEICGKLKPFDDFDKFTKNIKRFDAAEWKRKSIHNIGHGCSETHSWKFDLIRG